MLASGQGALKPRNCGSLCTHALGDLRLAEPSVVTRFEQEIEERGLFVLDAFNFFAHAGSSQQLLNNLFVGSHA